MSSLNLNIAVDGPMEALLEFVRGLKEFSVSHNVTATISVTGQLNVNEMVTVTSLLDQSIRDVFADNQYERPRHSMLRAQINTLGDLVQRTENDLLAITNFGQRSLDHVIDKLKSLGLELKER